MNTAAARIRGSRDGQALSVGGTTRRKLKGGLTRRLIASDRMMIAHVYFKKATMCRGTRMRTSRLPTSSRARCDFDWGRMGSANSLSAPVKCCDPVVPGAQRGGARRYSRCRCIQSAATGLAGGTDAYLRG